MRYWLVAALVLVPIPARADEGVHVALVGGAGLAQGLLGGRLELRKAHLALFAGTGLIYATTLGGDMFGSSGYGGVAGLRWGSGDRGDRLSLSAQFAFSTQRDPGDPQEHFPASWHHSNATTLTAGWRFRFGAFLADLGAGGGVRVQDHQVAVIPDLDLALGFEL
jgi:hypothetical protein